MRAGTVDVFQIVEYSRDSWNMEGAPLALLACLAGVFFLVYVDPRPAGPGILRAFIALVAVSIVVLLTHFLLEQMSEGTAIIKFSAGAIIIVAAIALYWNSPGDVDLDGILRAEYSGPAHVSGRPWLV